MEHHPPTSMYASAVYRGQLRQLVGSCTAIPGRHWLALPVRWHYHQRKGWWQEDVPGQTRRWFVPMLQGGQNQLPVAHASIRSVFQEDQYPPRLQDSDFWPPLKMPLLDRWQET